MACHHWADIHTVRRREHIPSVQTAEVPLTCVHPYAVTTFESQVLLLFQCPSCLELALHAYLSFLSLRQYIQVLDDTLPLHFTFASSSM